MSMTLNIPVHTTITLPDDWQSCKTPQELSYWIIAKFDEFETELSRIQDIVNSIESLEGRLDDYVYQTNTAISNLRTLIEDLGSSIADINNRTALVESSISQLQFDLNETNVNVSSLGATKQDLLQSGVNIKTINNQSLLGNGNISIPGQTLYRHTIRYANNSAGQPGRIDASFSFVNSDPLAYDGTTRLIPNGVYSVTGWCSNVNYNLLFLLEISGADYSSVVWREINNSGPNSITVNNDFIDGLIMCTDYVTTI